MRISRSKAWEILSNHDIVILGQGDISIEVLNSVEVAEDVIQDMVIRKSIYPVLDENMIRWSDGNTLLYDQLAEVFIEGSILYFIEYGVIKRTVAAYLINFQGVQDIGVINIGNMIQLLIDVMAIGNEPDQIVELNKYIEQVGIEKAIDVIVRVNCESVIL